MNEFWEKDLSSGYYDEIVKNGLVSKKGVQSFWHITTLNKISHYLSKDLVHLDYACGPGTLIGLFSESNSTGVDIASKQALENLSSKLNTRIESTALIITNETIKENRSKFLQKSSLRPSII